MNTGGAPGWGSASRRDPEHGFEEQVAFFGSEASLLFGTTYLPQGPPAAGLVLCPAICSDFLYNHRRETAIARRLAAAGVASQRFHYRGTGNSDGDSELMSFATMCLDTADARERLVAQSGVRSVAYLGSRVGGLVAAAAAREAPGAPLILLEPTLAGARFFREGFRAQLAADARARDSGRTGAILQAELERAGHLDLLGYTVDRPLFDSLSDRTLVEELGTGGRPILLVQLSAGDQLRSEYQELRAVLTDGGATVETTAVGQPDAWWFEDVEEQAPPSLLQTVEDWVVAHLPTTAPVRGPGR